MTTVFSHSGLFLFVDEGRTLRPIVGQINCVASRQQDVASLCFIHPKTGLKRSTKKTNKINKYHLGEVYGNSVECAGVHR